MMPDEDGDTRKKKLAMYQPDFGFSRWRANGGPPWLWIRQENDSLARALLGLMKEYCQWKVLMGWVWVGLGVG